MVYHKHKSVFVFTMFDCQEMHLTVLLRFYGFLCLRTWRNRLLPH